MNHLRFVEKWSLQQIADEFDISRERVRQLIGNSGTGFISLRKQELYDENKNLDNKVLSEMLGYTQPQTISSVYRKNGIRHEITGGRLKVGTEVENMVSEKLTELGIKNKLMPHFHTFDILLDSGVRVDVKSAAPWKNYKGKSAAYSFLIETKSRGNYCNYFILVLRDVLEFFVVPIEATSNSLTFCWPVSGKRISRLAQYHNRFDLLRG